MFLLFLDYKEAELVVCDTEQREPIMKEMKRDWFGLVIALRPQTPMHFRVRLVTLY
jgi:hypothetical protein